MKKFIPFFLIIFSFLSFQSCSSNNKTAQTETKDTVFAIGKVISNVQCRFDVTKSYALYLPSTYSKAKNYPIIYAFDAHGAGLLPVELFKDEAEKYGYILVGSNNSKNGNKWEVTSEIYDTLYNDTHRRFSIDNQRLYTAGFSGGSRVASSIAIGKGGINSVIGCGAGLGSQAQPQQKFGFYGIAGTADMNLTELIYLDSALANAGFRHFLDVFDGKHEWPNKEVAKDAFLWLELNATKDLQKSNNDTLINNTLKKWDESYKSLTTKNPYEAYLLCNKIINFFDGVANINKYKTEITCLESNPTVIKAKKHLSEIAKQETELQQYYSNSITTQTAEWWKTQINSINQKINSTSDKEVKYMYKRLLSYLSLATYMNINGAIKAGRFDIVENFNIIYELVEPENPEHAYISATLAMKKGKQEEAIAFLKQAAGLGFNELSRIENDSTLTLLKQHTKYSEIIELIKKNSIVQI
ncbi:MAG: hypothetical protein WCK02_16295 [Bacteroidota bacterium]